MGSKLKNKVALVTNAGNGIGRHVSILLAEEGASIIVNDADKHVDGIECSHKLASQVVEEITSNGGQAIVDFADLSLMKGGETAVRTALDNFGKLDILVNNMVSDKPKRLHSGIENLQPQDFDKAVMNVVKSTFTVTRHAAPYFRQQRSGRIVNITREVDPDHPEEAAASEAVVGFTRTIARDLGKYGVTCNGITSTVKATDFGGIDNGSNDLNSLDFFRAEAVLAAYLCTSSAAGINGNMFGVHEEDIYIHSNPTAIRSVYKGSAPTMDDMDMLVPDVLWDTH